MDAVAQRYHSRPSSIMGIDQDSVFALDFDLSIMIRAGQIERGEFHSSELVKRRQADGFEEVRALQERVQASYDKQNGIDYE